MRLLATNQNVEISGSEGSRSFSIEGSAKAFLILSDTLYSNKIRAVVRELSTNAYDSHIDAGCADKPFDVYLPTSLEPSFKIRDYGIGMSHEDCMTLYTTYFRSTKNNSNDSVGCLGLGSKSPFAYADSFTVESFFNGTKRVYTGYKNTNGPQFDLMHQEDTDEPNGICVIVPVQRYDNSSFLSEAKHVYKTFDVRPNFKTVEITFFLLFNMSYIIASIVFS
jgi:HSP90 family molecular chaperone